MKIPDPNAVFPNEYHTSCFIKNVVKAPNIQIGDYTYYDDPADPAGFEQNNVLFNWPEFGDRLIIGKYQQRHHLSVPCVRRSVGGEHPAPSVRAAL